MKQKNHKESLWKKPSVNHEGHLCQIRLFFLFFPFNSLLADSISYPPSFESLQCTNSVLGCSQAGKCSSALDLLKLGGTFVMSKIHTSINYTQNLHSKISQHVPQTPGSVPPPTLPITEQGCWKQSSGSTAGTQMTLFPCSHKGLTDAVSCICHILHKPLEKPRAHYFHFSRRF